MKSNAESPMERLLQVMHMLRDKAHGCPWDLKQSLRSLVPYTLEEVYEVVDAVESGDDQQLKDELGDLLFQVVFYAQIAGEEGRFGFQDIAATITDKLVRRHPHVFPEGDIANFGRKPELSAEEVVVNWEAIKQAEREAKGAAGKESRHQGVLTDIPAALPAIERAKKIQNRAARVGFDWENASQVIDKLKEETAELESAMAQHDQAAVESEVGDLLFTVVNLSRHLKIDPETALRGCNRKFERRFRHMEEELARKDQALSSTPVEELEQLWNQAKLTEK